MSRSLFQKKNVWPLSELGLLEEALRVPPVHVSNKRWVYVVAHAVVRLGLPPPLAAQQAFGGQGAGRE